MKTYLLIASLFMGNYFSSYSASAERDSSLVFFPGSRIYPAVFLDPLECQVNGASYLLFRPESDASLYSLVNFGFSRPVFAKNGGTYSWEVNLGAGTFTQFDLIKRENDTFLAGLVNNDYKLSGDLSVSKNNNVLRFKIFHVSSHLGDDYMLRHNDTLLNDKSVNYEQADLTWLRKKGNNYWYAGIGEIYTKYAFRERLSFHGGGLWNFGRPHTFNLFTSLNVKIFAENDFIPDIRAAFGVNINKESEPIMQIWLEYYSGQLPYSTLDYGRITWIGPALTICL
jgi:hypothetical protein